MCKSTCFMNVNSTYGTNISFGLAKFMCASVAVEALHKDMLLLVCMCHFTYTTWV